IRSPRFKAPLWCGTRSGNDLAAPEYISSSHQVATAPCTTPMNRLSEIFDDVFAPVRAVVITSDETVEVILLGHSQRFFGVLLVVEQHHPVYPAFGQQPAIRAFVNDVQLGRVVFDDVFVIDDG